MKRYSYWCIKNEQRTGEGVPAFLVFRAKARDIYEWAAIERYTGNAQRGPQRLPKPAKIAEVKRFFERDARNTIPTALLVSLNVPATGITSSRVEAPEVVLLNFEYDEERVPQERPGMIIDGQHRLLGVMEFQPELLLNVVAMVNVSDDETAFQFLVVNNKASRVSSNHLRALVNNYQEEALSQRLRDVRMSISQHLDFVGLVDTEEGSPFRGIIDWSDNQGENEPARGYIPPSSIESCIAYIKQKRIPELEDDAILLGFFLAIWSKVASKWAQQFRRGSHLVEKVPIICLTQFLVDNISYEYDNDALDITNFERVGAVVERITNAVSPKLWEVRWTARSLDTSAGRNMLLEALRTVRRNVNAGRNWYDDVSLVDLQSDLL